MQGLANSLRGKKSERKEVKEKMKKLISLFIALLFIIGQTPQTAFGFGNWGGGGGGGYSPYANATGVIRADGFWVYRGGALIGVDNIGAGRYVVYANGRPVYQRTILPPDIGKTTNITFEVEVVIGGQTVKKTITMGNISLREFWGKKLTLTAEGIETEVTSDELEKFIAGQADLFAGKTDAEKPQLVAKLAGEARTLVAQALSLHAGGLDPNLFSISEAFYFYNNGLLDEIRSSAVDQNGDPMYAAIGDRLWATDKYAAGLMISRNSWVYNYKFDAAGNPVKDAQGRYALDDANPIETNEYFTYANGIQTGSITSNKDAFQVSGKYEIKDAQGNGTGQTTSYNFTVATNTVLAKTFNDAFGRVVEEHEVLGVNDAQNGLVVDLAIEHIYGEAGRETKTVRYFGTETISVLGKNVSKNMEVTNRDYNAYGQLTSTTTTQVIKNLRDTPLVPVDRNNDGTIDEKDLVYGDVAWDNATELSNSTFAYNSLGQIYSADIHNLQRSEHYKAYYVYNRELVRFNLTPASETEPVTPPPTTGP